MGAPHQAPAAGALTGLRTAARASGARHAQVFNGKDNRGSVEQYVHWGVATFPAILVRVPLVALEPD